MKTIDTLRLASVTGGQNAQQQRARPPQPKVDCRKAKEPFRCINEQNGGDI